MRILIPTTLALSLSLTVACGDDPLAEASENCAAGQTVVRNDADDGWACADAVAPEDSDTLAALGPDCDPGDVVIRRADESFDCTRQGALMTAGASPLAAAEAAGCDPGQFVVRNAPDDGWACVDNPDTDTDTDTDTLADLGANCDADQIVARNMADDGFVCVNAAPDTLAALSQTCAAGNLVALDAAGTWVCTNPAAGGGGATNVGLTLAGTTLELTDTAGVVTIDLVSLVDDGDADPDNETLQSAVLNGTSLELTDSGGTTTVDLAALGGDTDDMNEVNATLVLNGTTLELADAAGTLTADLSGLGGPGGGVNTTLVLNGTTLELTDSAGQLDVDLSGLVDDADADDANEVNTALTLNGTTLELTDSAGTLSADLAGLGGGTFAPHVVIPLWQAGANFNMTNTTGADLANCESGLDPTTLDAAGNIEVRLTVRITATTAGTHNFQLRTHDGTTEGFPIVNTDGWTFATTQTGIVAQSPWKAWAAGTNFHEVHLFGWVDAGATAFNSAYLMARPNQ